MQSGNEAIGHRARSAQRVSATSLATLSVAALAALACNEGGPRYVESALPDSAIAIESLLLATHDAEAALRLSGSQMTLMGESLEADHPLWPVYTYLLGEAHRLRGETDMAGESHRRLVEWAAGDPLNDGWGGSGLAAVSLWRLLASATSQATVDSTAARGLLALADSLRRTRLVRGMFRTPILSALPQLEEEIARLTALVAWRAGLQEEARERFVTFMAMARDLELSVDERGLLEVELSDDERAMLEDVLASGLARPDLLALAVGRRLQLLRGRDYQAELLLRRARRSTDSQIRAEAALYLADLPTAGRRAASALLDSAIAETADPEVRQEALFQRGLRNAVLATGDSLAFRRDMTALEEAFPEGRRTADALWQLARHYEDLGDLDEALGYFVRLREFTGPNEYGSRSLYRPALALYTVGRSREAAALLEQLEDRGPGDLYVHSLFWLGRIAEESGEGGEAARYFAEVIEQAPWDYYGLRALMHTNMGGAARNEFWPDPETAAAIQAAYDASHVDSLLAGGGPYHLRLRFALETGLYRTALEAESEMRRLFTPRRLEDLGLQEVDSSGWLPRVAALLALRQDARAAKDWVADAGNRLTVAGAVGYGASDWPLASLLSVAAEEPNEMQAAAQRDARYLKTAYPRIFIEPLAAAARPHSVEPELLYGVARIESAFFPAALSRDGALGLFQFTEATFRQLNRRWELSASAGTDSWVEYLLDPRRSVELGARWFALLPDSRLRRSPDGAAANTLLRLLEHQKGYSNVKASDDRWVALGRDDDIEYMIETFGFADARIFARRVIPGMFVARAAQFFEGR
ncbi:MAG: transglycosylase SLT domain-containing protein [Gemmatimonadota bacterium]|nr:MAG: transglycosylase SLT domain-containing protein [Gemmatimonadota bacterium]